MKTFPSLLFLYHDECRIKDSKTSLAVLGSSHLLSETGMFAVVCGACGGVFFQWGQWFGGLSTLFLGPPLCCTVAAEILHRPRSSRASLPRSKSGPTSNEPLPGAWHLAYCTRPWDTTSNTPAPCLHGPRLFYTTLQDD